MATLPPPPPAVEHREGAAARALTSLSSWIAWVCQGAYEWLASAVLRLCPWGGGGKEASDKPSDKSRKKKKKRKPAGQKPSNKARGDKPRTKRCNDFPVDLREKRNDSEDLLPTQPWLRSPSPHQNLRDADPSEEDTVKLLHKSFKTEASKCQKKYTICLMCFIANFGEKNQVRPTPIKNEEISKYY
ncbi:hypothetical protein E2562_014298 [Oryza meyeriana var. granulata]|uniref:Uncharacterized protein n=1 Tax=Oryza meyeriana var. granulata TaxID=110450 RepID=A0A6G1C603_9ORYZ|nr:hypothetical protein E2562_014298 [Oryza meyeriana var. granulata]